MNMKEEKDPKKEPKDNGKKRVCPGKIKGKLEVPDTRERRDGPGGN